MAAIAANRPTDASFPLRVIDLVAFSLMPSLQVRAVEAEMLAEKEAAKQAKEDRKRENAASGVSRGGCTRAKMT